MDTREGGLSVAMRRERSKGIREDSRTRDPDLLRLLRWLGPHPLLLLLRTRAAAVVAEAVAAVTPGAVAAVVRTSNSS